MFTHIVFEASASGHLREVIAKREDLKGEIVGFYDDLSVGPIDNFNWKKRIKWWEDVLIDNKYISAKESAELMDDTKKIELVKKIKMPIVLWVADVAQNELGFLRLCPALNDFNEQIFLIQIPKNISENDQRPLSLGELGPEVMEGLWEYKREITKHEIIDLAKIWNEFLPDQSLLRVRRGEFNYEQLPENYFDAKILKLCLDDFRSAAEIISIIYAGENFKVNDSYVAWRIRELIKKHKLVFSGDLGLIGDFKVKIVD